MSSTFHCVIFCGCNNMCLFIMFSLADIEPSVMIVEEAAEILESQLVAVIPPSVQHLILIGDHKQLKPTVMYNYLARHHNLDVSMFERLINCKLPHQSLGKQCRMRDELAELLRVMKIYETYDTSDKVREKLCCLRVHFVYHR